MVLDDYIDVDGVRSFKRRYMGPEDGSDESFHLIISYKNSRLKDDTYKYPDAESIDKIITRFRLAKIKGVPIFVSMNPNTKNQNEPDS